MSGLTVVVGYGSTGHAAVSALVDAGVDLGEIVAVDEDLAALDSAVQRGLSTVYGDATRPDVMRQADVPRAAALVLATRRDDTNTVIAIRARDLAPQIRITATAEEHGNAAILRRSGVDCVIVPEEAAGRVLAVAATASRGSDDAPRDLSGTVWGIQERVVLPEEAGRTSQELADVVLAVARDQAVPRFDPTSPDVLNEGDRILYLPGAHNRSSQS